MCEIADGELKCRYVGITLSNVQKWKKNVYNHHHNDYTERLILGLRPASERRRYKLTLSLIGWVQT